MQFIDYQNCSSLESVEAELCRLVRQEFITQAQADATDPQKILRLFRSDLGQKLMEGNVLREFKFSILDDAQKYGHGLSGEQVLLQGVVDCALLEPDGITIVDFKTDRVTEDSMDVLADRYRSQLQIYGDAMERIYGQSVKGAYLYLFRLDRFLRIF